MDVCYLLPSCIYFVSKVENEITGLRWVIWRAVSAKLSRNLCKAPEMYRCRTHGVKIWPEDTVCKRENLNPFSDNKHR